MKKILSLIAIMLGALVGYSQAPGILNYQGVARNSVGNVLVNKTINLRLTIRDGAAAGPTVYQESRVVTTNPFGLFNVQVGSPGATSVTGTIPGVNWAVGAKFIQVEIDPNGGTSFINIGTAQLASVPYSLYSNLSGDLVLPFNKTQADAGTLFKITNSNTTSAGATALEGLTNSTAGNANAIIGTVTSASPGGFSAGVRGINNGTGGLGIGVYGSQAGSGWGVYGFTPGGIGVNGASNTGTGLWGSSSSGTGVFGTSSTGSAGVFSNTNASNTAITLNASSNGNGDVLVATTTGTGSRAGLFQNNNAANTQHVLAVNNAGGSGNAVNVTTAGTGRAGLFAINNAASTANAVEITNPGAGDGVTVLANGSGKAGLFNITGAANTNNAIDVTTLGLGRAGLFTVNNTANATQALDVSSNGAAGSRGIRSRHSGLGSALELAITNAANTNNVFSSTQTGLGRSGLIQITNAANTDNALEGFTSGTGWAGRFWSNNATPRALFTTGAVRMTGINEALNRILTSDASGNATWVDPSGIGVLTGSGTLNFVPKWTPSGTNLGNSLLFDDGNNVGLGTTTPTHRFDVTHSGSTGIGVNSTAGFSVVDINAASGDAALRFGAAGVNQWNIRNQPGVNNLQFFELGGGGERMAIYDGTGNIAIGGSPGSYRLDVLHGGSTGIRIQSSASFSVLDIDAATGDAAIRLAKAGVNQWNIRNRPADDYLEIFELGGGGSRVVIQDGTGNVGIGETTSPSYKLDVLHGGSTGIRSRSSGSFSVVDIDAASGDAALRFANNGVNQWNIRNRPADDYLEIFELGGGGSRVVIQDGTGNVGIGETTSPSYKLDVLHGGSTGIRSRSSGSFSVVDIDAATGDAALRFANNGVNQWNIRNQPGTDNLQIFELGGGGERMHIQDGTGNVSIGGEPSPTYRLDVLHGGATGIRSRSSSTFSLVDIDADNGDAALRFAKAGVNQWNTRNNPATDDYQIFELGGGGERLRIENTTGNVVVSSDFTVLGTKAFTMDHPLDPANKLLRHAAAESNEVINFYSGNIVTDANGKATVQLPDYFEAINKDFRYQLTVIGSFAQAIISKEVVNNQFEIATNQPNVKVSWEVKGVRNDNRMKQHPFVAVEEKPASQRGTYWDPASHNQPNSKHVSNSSADNKQSSLNYTAPVSNKPVPESKGGSLDYVAPVSTNKKADVSGSVQDVKPTEKKVEAKPADTKGTSIEQTTPAKPVEQKKTTGPDESTKTE